MYANLQITSEYKLSNKYNDVNKHLKKIVDWNGNGENRGAISNITFMTNN